MAKGDSTDILMNFVYQKRAIPGESQTDPAMANGTKPKMLAGFTKGYTFELDSFTFAVGVEDSSDAADGAASGKSLPKGQTVVDKDGKPVRKTSLGAFKGFRSGGPHPKYPVTVQPVTFTRGIDLASTKLFYYGVNSLSFDSATLIKRKAAGGPLAGEPFLRLDFNGVLITEVSWSNDEPVKETCKFITRAITVAYRPQLPDGTLGAIKQGFWSMNPWEKEVIL